MKLKHLTYLLYKSFTEIWRKRAPNHEAEVLALVEKVQQKLLVSNCNEMNFYTNGLRRRVGLDKKEFGKRYKSLSLLSRSQVESGLGKLQVTW